MMHITDITHAQASLVLPWLANVEHTIAIMGNRSSAVAAHL